MWLTKLAISRRVTISMVVLALVILGVVGASRMPMDFLPKIEVPVVTVLVPYPGAGPEEIEQRVLKQVEDQVSTINGVDSIDSTGQENIGGITIRFNYGTDINVAANDVRDAVERARGSFPEGVKTPSILKIDISASPILGFGIVGNRSSRDLRKLVDDEIKPMLGQVGGVASVSVTGGLVREVQVLADVNRLEAVGLSLGQLAQLLQAENLNVPAGSIKQGGREYAIRVMGEFKSPDEIRNLRINTPSGGTIRLSDVAEVYDTVADPDTLSRINGQDSINMYVLKQSDANTVAVADGIKAKLAALFGDKAKVTAGTLPADLSYKMAFDRSDRVKAAIADVRTALIYIKAKLAALFGGKAKVIAGTLPADLSYKMAFDQSDQVKEAIADVRTALIYGALLAAIVAFIFLHNLRATIIIVLAIPTSMIATFLPVGLGFGFTMNMMVMLGLALSVGILIDDSIVVLENISRHLEAGEQPKAAAYNGRMEIGAAAIAITLVDVVVFVPVALMGGMVGQIFYSFGITVATCTLFSLFMSFTLTPMLASWWFARRDKTAHAGHGLFAAYINWFERAYSGLERNYRRLLDRATNHPWVTLLAAYSVLIALFLLVFQVAPAHNIKWLTLQREFMPQSDQGRVAVSIESAVGAKLEQTDTLTRLIESRIEDKQKFPEVQMVSTIVGQGGNSFVGVGNSGGQFASIDINIGRRRTRLHEGMRTDIQFVEALRRELADIPGATLKIAVSQSMGPGGGASIQFNLLNEDSAELGVDALAIVSKLKQIPGLMYVDMSSKPGRPEAWAKVDRIRAADYGLSVSQISQTVRAAYEGDTSSKYRVGGDEYDLRVELRQSDRKTISDLGSLFVGRSPSGQPVYLRDVADIVMTTGPSRVERYNRQRTTMISAYTDAKVIAMGEAQQRVVQALKEADLRGSTYVWAGQVKMMRESFSRMGSAMILAILLIYLLTAGLYNSILEPLNIMLTLPIAMVGAIVGLLITHNNMSIISIIGIIMLLGLVGKNAILMVDFTNTLRGRGMPRNDAVRAAGPVRLRPILMTTLSAVAGMLPTALAVNEGSEWRAPMADVVIFGLLMATMVSLVIVPCTYIILDNFGGTFTRLGRWAMGPHGRRALKSRMEGSDNE